MRRLTAAVFAVVLTVGAFRYLYLVYSHKFFDITGTAQWIWLPHRLSLDVPLAFFATRDFDLPANRYYTRIKVIGDPEYTLYFNGREIGGRRLVRERAIDVYDVSTSARTGRNRIVIATRSTRGVGGLIASVDLSDETSGYVVTGKDWRVYRAWHPDLLVRDHPGWLAPMLLGSPPIGRWNYLAPTAGKLAVPVHEVIQPRQVFPLRGRLPEIKVAGGIAIAVVQPTRALAAEFGPLPLDGRVRLTIDYDDGTTRLVRVRMTHTREELLAADWDTHSFIFAPGERTVTDVNVHQFRYVLVYGARARPEVVR